MNFALKARGMDFVTRFQQINSVQAEKTTERNFSKTKGPLSPGVQGRGKPSLDYVEVP